MFNLTLDDITLTDYDIYYIIKLCSGGFIIEHFCIEYIVTHSHCIPNIRFINNN